VPRVSAIVTTFNRARLLPNAVRSVLSQTFRDFELIVLDNSSTDGTPAALRGFSDDRIRYIVHAPCGIAEARNRGLREARGKYIAFLDDDDEWLPPKLALQVEAFERGPDSLGLVYGGFVRIDDRGTEYAVHAPVLHGKILRALLWQCDPFTGSASNPMMRASALRALGGFNNALTTSEDWELYLRLAERFDIGSVPETVVRIRTHRAARLGDRIDEARRVEELVLDRYGASMEPRLRSLYYQKIGGKLCRTGAVREGRARILDAIRADPSNPLSYAQYGLSLLGGGAYERAHGLWARCRRARP
jgi:glycosyltransferase involved in cell wall biosynthesis